MRHCQHCGSNLPENARFCLECGQAQGVPIPPEQARISTPSASVPPPPATAQPPTRGQLSGCIGIGCGGLVVLFLLAGIVGAIGGDAEDDQASVSEETTAEEVKAEKTREREKTSSSFEQKRKYTNPRTPEETVLASIEEETRAPLEDDVRVLMETDQNGCNLVQLSYKTVGATSIAYEMERFYRAIYGGQYGNSMCNVTVTAYGTLTDRFGQEYSEALYQTTLGGDVADRINWSNSSQADFPSLWTVDYVHPSAQAEIDQANAEQALDCVQEGGMFDFDWLECP